MAVAGGGGESWPEGLEVWRPGLLEIWEDQSSQEPMLAASLSTLSLHSLDSLSTLSLPSLSTLSLSFYDLTLCLFCSLFSLHLSLKFLPFLHLSVPVHISGCCCSAAGGLAGSVPHGLLLQSEPGAMGAQPP